MTAMQDLGGPFRQREDMEDYPVGVGDVDMAFEWVEGYNACLDAIRPTVERLLAERDEASRKAGIYHEQRVVSDEEKKRLHTVLANLTQAVGGYANCTVCGVDDLEADGHTEDCAYYAALDALEPGGGDS